MTSEVKSVYESFSDLSSPFLISDGVEFIEYNNIVAPKEHLNGSSKLINLNVNFVDEYILLDKSYFVFNIEVLKSDNSRYTDADEIALTNNGIMHLFSTVEFKIDGVQIEQFSNPGITTTVSSLMNYGHGTSKTHGRDFGWVLDQDDYKAKSSDNAGFGTRKKQILNQATTKGRHSFIVPFTHVFGDCKKVLRGAKITISLVRNSYLDSNGIYKTDEQQSSADKVADGKVNIVDLTFMVAIPHFNDSLHATISEYLLGKPTIPMQFNVKYTESTTVPQSREFNWNLSLASNNQKLYGVAVVFQTSRDNNQKANSALFDHLYAEYCHLSMNGKIYPGTVLNDLNKDTYNDVYYRFLNFRKLFTSSLPEIDSLAFKTAYPMYCFNLSHQKVKILNDTYNIALKFKFDRNVPANTTCYAVFFYDKYMTFTTIGDTNMKPLII